MKRKTIAENRLGNPLVRLKEDRRTDTYYIKLGLGLSQLAHVPVCLYDKHQTILRLTGSIAKSRFPGTFSRPMENRDRQGRSI
jgi:hypothetical protein